MPPNHLDFLEVLDRHTRESPLGEVTSGDDLHRLAQGAGLATHGQLPAARWTGELIGLGYVRTRSRMAGVPDLPLGVPWTDRELDRFIGFQVTASGREEGDRIRRLRRGGATDAALGERLSVLDHAWLTEPQRGALAVPHEDLRAALDDARHAAAVGAAKDLVEAACKVVLAHAGEAVPAGTSLPALFKQALASVAASGAEPDSDLGRGLSATVQRLAELRNTVGSGHGRAAATDVGEAHARLAAAAASAVAEFLLGSVAD